MIEIKKRSLSELMVAYCDLSTGEKSMITRQQAIRKVKNRISAVRLDIENGESDSEELYFLLDLLEYMG